MNTLQFKSMSVSLKYYKAFCSVYGKANFLQALMAAEYWKALE